MLCLTVGFTAHASMAQDASMVEMRRKALGLAHEKKFAEANAFLNQELAAAGNSTNKLLRVYIAFADVAYKAEDKANVFKYIQLANIQNKKAKDRDAEAKIADLTANYYCNTIKDYKSGLPYREQALSLIRLIYPINDPHIGEYENSLADTYRKLGQPTKAAELEAINSNRTAIFMEGMQRKIKALWRPGASNSSKKVDVFFKYGADGKALNARIGKSSGFPDYDNYCLTIINTVHLDPVMVWEFDAEPMNVEFNFAYNLFSQGRSNTGPETGTSAANKTADKPGAVQINNIGSGSDAQAKTNGQSKGNLTIDKVQLQLECHYKLKALGKDPNLLSPKSLQIQFELFGCFLDLNQIDDAKKLVTTMESLQNSTPAAKMIFKAESAILLKKEQKLVEAERVFAEVVADAEFGKLESKDTKSTILKAYGDVLYMQNKTAEANKIYQQIRELKLEDGKSEFPRVHDIFSGPKTKDQIENKNPKGVSEI